jgi:hypothetical protein
MKPERRTHLTTSHFCLGRYGVLEHLKSGLERLNVHLRNLMLGIHSAGSLTTREQLVGYDA